MRILAVQESDYLERGPHQSHHLLERLAQRGHEVRVIDYPIGWKSKRSGSIIAPYIAKKDSFKVIAPGVTVIRPPILKIPTLSYASLFITHRREIIRQLKNFHPDVIIGFGLLNARLAIDLGREYNVPFVYYIIDELHRLVPEQSLRPFALHVEKQNYLLADRILSINQGLEEYTQEMGADPAKTEIIRAGVDIARFTNADGRKIRHSLGIADNETVLFFMGWLYDFSGIDVLAEQIIRRADDDIKLLIIGKGDLWDKISRIRKGFEDRVILEDWKPYSEVPSFVKASDICLLPSKKDPIMHNIVPIKMYEYMAAGRPVIATRLSGLEKEFGETNGVCYIDDSTQALQVAEELKRTKSIGANGERAFQFVKDNDWSIIVDAFEKTLGDVMAR